MTAPTPFVPADANLQALPWMRLDINRLFNSDLYAYCVDDNNGGWAFMAAVTLWGKSWHQLPAGSLPDDDKVIRHLSGAGSRWPKMRDIVMRGWVKCSDGRLYHRVIAEQVVSALEALSKRERDRERLKVWRETQRAAGNLGKNGGLLVPHGTETVSETVSKQHVETVSETPHETLLNNERTGIRNGTIRNREEKKTDARKRALVTTDDLVADGLDEQTAGEWLDHRRRKKANLTPRAWEGVKAEAARAGLTPAVAVAKALSRGWTGFEAAWVEKPNGAHTPTAPVYDFTGVPNGPEPIR